MDCQLFIQVWQKQWDLFQVLVNLSANVNLQDLNIFNFLSVLLDACYSFRKQNAFLSSILFFFKQNYFGSVISTQQQIWKLGSIF